MAKASPNKITSDVRLVAFKRRHQSTGNAEVRVLGTTRIAVKGGGFKTLVGEGATEAEVIGVLRTKIAEELAWQRPQVEYPKTITVTW